MAAFKVRTAVGVRLSYLEADRVTLGRDRACELKIDDDGLVSRRHAVVERRDGEWWINDCGSRNGTHLNGTRLADSAQLREGDELRIGSTTLVFTADSVDPNATISEKDGTAEPAVALSERERQIVAGVAGGLTDKEIAARLSISVTTVRSHLERIRDKTGRRRRADLARLASELALEPLA